MFNRKYKKAIHVIEEEMEECKKWLNGPKNANLNDTMRI